jgi:hypothetical protein
VRKKNYVISLLIFLLGCSSMIIPPNYIYQEMKTSSFTLVSWQKKSLPTAVYKIYIEGDGHAFNTYGIPTDDPTPKGTFVRNLAFNDPSPNVIYLARPCQYITSSICSKRYWTSARFAPEVIKAEFEAIKQIAGNNPVILIGYSGGAQIAGLIATTKPSLNIKKIITIAGNLDHSRWTQLKSLAPLNESMDLKDYQKNFLEFPQIHYVGGRDQVIPPILIQDFVKRNSVIEVSEATHDSGWESIYQEIWREH